MEEIRARTVRWVYETYRKRFGIKTRYRQMNQARIRTCTRSSLQRLLFVGIALILRNVWGWRHLNLLAERRGSGVIIREQLLRLSEMLLWIQQMIEQSYGLHTSKPIPPSRLAT